MFLKFEIRSVERNQAGIKRHKKTGSIDWKESSRNWRNLKLFKEKAFFLLHILIGRKKAWSIELQINKNFEKSWKMFMQNHLKNYFYDMTWMFMTSNNLQNQFFQRKFSFIKFPHSFLFSHPKKNALNISRSLILEGHKTQHTITSTKYNKVLLVVCATSKWRYSQGDM